MFEKLTKLNLRNNYAFFKQNFYKKISLKNPKPYENVKKIPGIKCLSFNF